MLDRADPPRRDAVLGSSGRVISIVVGPGEDRRIGPRAAPIPVGLAFGIQIGCRCSDIRCVIGRRLFAQDRSGRGPAVLSRALPRVLRLVAQPESSNTRQIGSSLISVGPRLEAHPSRYE